MRVTKAVLACSLVLLAALGVVPRPVAITHASGPNAIRTLAGFTTNSLPATDDGSTGLVPIGFSINFFGTSYDNLYVNNNGNVTFDGALPNYTPFGLVATNHVIIAPYFADVDTRLGNVVQYGRDVVDGHPAFGVNSIGVGYFSQHVDKLNDFQQVLIDRSDTGPGNFDIEFNYNRIQWETGDASGGNGGLGGSSARVGYSNGTGVISASLELDGSGINGAFLDSNPTTGLIYGSRNSAQLGRYLFEVRNGAVDPVDLGIVKLEVTQAIQDLSNSVDLVANKQTYVRVHVQSLIGGKRTNITARLYRTLGGVRQSPALLPSNPGGTIAVQATPDRGTLNDSFYFALPNDWTNAGHLALEAEVNPLRNPPETSYTNNVQNTVVLFVATPHMRLREYNVRYATAGGTYTATDAQLFDLRDWLRRAYPIDSLDATELTLDMTDLHRLPTCTDVNARLTTARFWDTIFSVGSIAPQTRYYGMVNDGGGYMRGCAVAIPGNVASGPTGSNTTSFTWDHDGVSYGDWYGGHELGHTYGRSHADFCGAVLGVLYPYPNGIIGGPTATTTQFYGFDIYLHDLVVYPPTWTDLMTYCNNEWVSDFTYKGIHSQLVSEGGLAPPDHKPASHTATTDYLVVRGLVATTVPSATLAPLYHITTTGPFPVPVPSAYTIRLRDASHTLLAQYAFTPQVGTDAEMDPNPVGLLNEVVPYSPGTQVIEITNGDQVLATRTVSAHAPTVQVVVPTGGANIGQGDLTVQWQQSDADGDTLYATVLLSTDGGATYRPLRTDLVGSSTTIPAAEVSGSTQARVRIIVSDGVNTTQADSPGLFTIANQPPHARIITPADGSSFAISQTVTLAGEGMNLQAGSLPASAYQWSSNINGVLGTGPQVARNDLSPGSHTLTLTVTDANGLTASATRTIIISTTVPPPAPAIVLSPRRTTYVAVLGSTTPHTQTLTIRDPAGRDVRWTATSDAPWLGLSASRGTDLSGVVATANPTNLATGAYTGTLTFQGTSGGVAVIPQAATIYLQVMPPPGPMQGDVELPFLRR